MSLTLIIAAAAAQADSAIIVTGSRELLDPDDLRPAPAADVVWRLVELVRPALAGYGDEAYVEKLVEQVLANGTGSERQRAAVAESGRLGDAVALAVAHMRQ